MAEGLKTMYAKKLLKISGMVLKSPTSPN